MQARLLSSGQVLYAEPNYRLHLDFVPNDPDFSSQWALTAINAPGAWDITIGTSAITIAIIDTGIDLTHPDLMAKVVPGATFVPGTTYPQDDNGHGTHVAGVAAASTNNGIGIAGVSWNARLMPVKVVDASGNGTYAQLIQGIGYAVDNGARILNMSLGGYAYSQALQDVITYAHDQRGALLIAASGNCGSGGNNCPQVNAVQYPAAMAGVVSVAATTVSDAWAGFSTHNSYVDVAAPGVGIYSTYWTTLGHGYTYFSGTSQATPHVSGLAALIWSVRPGLTADEVETVLENTAADVNAAIYPGRDDYLGYGRIDARRAVDAVPPLVRVNDLPPIQSTPTFTVSWGGSDENSGIRFYSIQYRDGPDPAPWVDWLTNVTITASVFSGTPGHTYYFRASAVDWAGNVAPYRGGDGDTFTTIASCRVSGTIYSNRARPLAGAVVQAEPGSARAYSQADGHYDLVPTGCNGTYSISASMETYASPPPVYGVVMTPTTVITGMDIYLPRADDLLASHNGGFEWGSFAGGWLPSGSPLPTVVSDPVHTGAYAAYLGTPPPARLPDGESAIQITVTIPLTMYAPTLSFMYRLQTMDNAAYDILEVRLNEIQVFWDGYLGTDWGTLHDLGWRFAWVDLSAYRGETVTVRIAVSQSITYGGYPTGAAVDEVSMSSSPGGPLQSFLPTVLYGEPPGAIPPSLQPASSPLRERPPARPR
jgi:thermitase